MSEIVGSTLTEYPNGLISVVNHRADGSSCTAYIGRDRHSASRAHGEAMLQMKSWQPYRAEIEALLASIPAISNAEEAA